jgi:hypothetical protein
MNYQWGTGGRRSYASFLVRFWLTKRPPCEERLVIEVQSVQSGERLRFDELENALTYLHNRAIEVSLEQRQDPHDESGSC